MDKLTELKAEAFDLLLRKEKTVQQIDARLREIYADISQLEQDAGTVTDWEVNA